MYVHSIPTDGRIFRPLSIIFHIRGLLYIQILVTNVAITGSYMKSIVFDAMPGK